MDIGDITDTHIKPVLEGIRQGRGVAGSPLFALEIVRQRLRHEGMAETPANLEWVLTKLLCAIVEEQLAVERGVKAGTGRPSPLPGERALETDFRSDNPSREAWSALYHRYIAPHALSIKQIATTTLHDPRQINRRIGRGFELLVRVVREREQAARATTGLQMRSSLAPTVAGRRHNLPYRRNHFVGREQAIAEITRLLADAALVTLVGPGGVGKTRLALRVAERRAPDYPDGVWLADLAQLEDGALVAPAVADVLDVVATTSQTSLGALVAKLHAKRFLLVIDNCEQVIDACAELAGALLAACAGLSILATSRAPLEVEGERVFRVPSLDLPSAADDDLERIAQCEAIQLFVARAAALRPGFALDATTAGSAAEICRRLDGIPLAIELAAARTRMLPVGIILRQLDDPLAVLTGSSRSAPDRQKTLRAAIEWSYDLLTEAEKTLFARLAVFRGGWSAEAVLATCAGGLVDPASAIDILHSLVDQSLVADAMRGAEMRYRFLDTIRHFALDCLVNGGEHDRVRRAHLSCMVDLAERAEEALKGEGRAYWLERLDVESDNFRAAFDWVEASADPRLIELGLRLGAALWRYWYTRGYVHEDPVVDAAQVSSPFRVHARNYLTEGRARLAWLLDHAGSDLSPAIHARALHAAGTLATYQADYAAAHDLLARSLAIRRELGDEQGVAHSIGNMAGVAQLRGDLAQAWALFEAGLDLYRKRGDTWGIAVTLSNLAEIAMQQGDDATARRLLEESLQASEAVGDQAGMASVLDQLGAVAHNQGELAVAQGYYDQALGLHKAQGDHRGMALTQVDLGCLALDLGQHATARMMFEAALRTSQDLGDPWTISRFLKRLGVLDLYDADYAAAFDRLKEAQALAKEIDNRPTRAAALHYLCRLQCEVGRVGEARRWFDEGGLALPVLERRAVDMLRLGISGAALAAAEARYPATLALAAAVQSARAGLVTPIPPAEDAALERYVAVARAAVAAGVAAAAWARGAAMSTAEALEEVLHPEGLETTSVASAALGEASM